MNIFRRAVAVMAGAAVVMAGSVTVASPAVAAVDWINHDQVWSVSNPRTALSVDTPRGTVQVRYGTHQGKQYGWARALNAPSDYVLAFEVDTNGDRRSDEGAREYLTGNNAAWTWGAAASSHSARAFRACILSYSEMSCAETSYRTGWW
ncbi:hypothetical protein [Nocardiopsis kunsanensis]|uniref:Secreted protein n=1 Tax=Nocardiopsis kunsanensis TaxID=141693 RepID=A0A918XKK0_9ACTN|nr:hypothetical protein [Nocardiopsis kunsanensis]GHD36381.1 hypothetical protein GCM10007147_43700 [Nocardiopsis kunsanensis]